MYIQCILCNVFNPFTGAGALLRPTGSDLLISITTYFLYGPYDRVIVVVTAITRVFCLYMTSK